MDAIAKQLELIKQHTTSPKSKKVKFVCTSDTHLRVKDTSLIPDGDVLLHAGDFSNRGTDIELKQFNDFLGKLPHRIKVVIAGNHEEGLSFDHLVDPDSRAARKAWEQLNDRMGVTRRRQLLTNCMYLEDEMVEIQGIKIYGSPWSPLSGTECNAFQLPSGPGLMAKWQKIPDDVNILMTHGPPYGICDRTTGGLNAGCTDLLKVVQKIKPQYHVFGHIHEGYGRYSDGTTTFINASLCNRRYQVQNKPVVFEMDGGT